MTLDSTFLPLAERLINEFGKTVTFTSKPLPGEYDRETGKTTPVSAQTFTAKIAPPDMYNQFFIDGDLIQVGDHKTILANQGNNFVPENGWALDLDGETWKIVNVKPFYSGELIAAWELRLRK